jgi:hypothetical protein
MQRGVDACETEPGESEDERRKGLEHVSLFVAPLAARARLLRIAFTFGFRRLFCNPVASNKGTQESDINATGKTAGQKTALGV